MSAISPSLAPDIDVDLAQSHLCNADLAPVPQSARKWRVGSYAALWISMSACIPTYMLASSLIGGGMNWWQAIMTISCHGEAYRSCERAGILSPTL
jgi:NCS1 family nucleobase:cation symporter-1